MLFPYSLYFMVLTASPIKILKTRTPQKIAVIVLKFEGKFYHRKKCHKVVDRMARKAVWAGSTLFAQPVCLKI